MPSWTARLLPSAPEPSSTARSLRPEQGDTTNVHTPQSNSISSLQRPPLQSAASGTSSSQDGSPHGRSISYSFPSILRVVKKEEKRGVAEASSTNSNDAEHGNFGNGKAGRRPSGGDVKGNSSSTDRDLTTGHCMTCDSLVRWPKALQVFRCTICLMINDLRPVTKPGSESGSANAPPSRVEDAAALPASEKGERAVREVMFTNADCS